MLVLIFLFTVLPIVELYLLIEVGQVIGAWETMAIVFVTGVVGAYAARSQGRAIFMSTQQKLAQGEVPANNLLAGVLVFVGGVLLVTPGFITDAFGLCMVLPWTRALILIVVKKYLARQVRSGRMQMYTNVGGSWQSSESWKDVTHQGHRIDRPPLRDVTPKSED